MTPTKPSSSGGRSSEDQEGAQVPPDVKSSSSSRKSSREPGQVSVSSKGGVKMPFSKSSKHSSNNENTSQQPGPISSSGGAKIAASSPSEHSSSMEKTSHHSSEHRSSSASGSLAKSVATSSSGSEIDLKRVSKALPEFDGWNGPTPVTGDPNECFPLSKNGEATWHQNQIMILIFAKLSALITANDMALIFGMLYEETAAVLPREVKRASEVLHEKKSGEADSSIWKPLVRLLKQDRSSDGSKIWSSWNPVINAQLRTCRHSAGEMLNAFSVRFRVTILIAKHHFKISDATVAKTLDRIAIAMDEVGIEKVDVWESALDHLRRNFNGQRFCEQIMCHETLSDETVGFHKDDVRILYFLMQGLQDDVSKRCLSDSWHESLDGQMNIKRFKACLGKDMQPKREEEQPYRDYVRDFLASGFNDNLQNFMHSESS